jgi:DNA-binding transcriptional LysR family regulator
MIETDRIRYALLVAREESFAAAAAIIPMSQSALTRSVQALEHEYGVQLFERGANGTTVTPRGREFLSRCESYLSRELELDAELRSLSSTIRPVAHFGLDPIKAATFLPPLLDAMARDGIRCKVSVDSPANLRHQLRLGQIEFYLGGIPLLDLKSEAWTAAYRVSVIPGGFWVLAVRGGHPLLGQDLTSRVLADYGLVMGYYLREEFSRARLARLGLRPPVVEADDYQILARLAAEHDYVVMATDFLCDMRPDLGLVALPVRVPAPRHMEWGFVQSRGQTLTRASTAVQQWLEDAVRRSFDAFAEKNGWNPDVWVGPTAREPVSTTPAPERVQA